MTLRILDYPWHQAHLYRLTALPAEFTVARVREPAWNTLQRPVPGNVRFVDVDAIDPHDYDVALLHLDQWCDRLNVRASSYRLMKQITSAIPQTVIFHGTIDDGRNRRALLRLMEDLPVVCNSHQAALEFDVGDGRLDRYGNPQFRAIIHGYQDEFYNYPLEQRKRSVITICSGNELSREYHGIPLLERLERDVPLDWYGPAGNREWKSNFDDYREMLASSLIYLSPTRRGPMPGARTEAMLSGACIVSVPGHDFGDYVINSYTGFIVETYVQARHVLRRLLNNPDIAYGVGQEGRKMARVAFSSQRYVRDWLTYLPTIGVEAA